MSTRQLFVAKPDILSPFSEVIKKRSLANIHILVLRSSFLFLCASLALPSSPLCSVTKSWTSEQVVCPVYKQLSTLLRNRGRFFNTYPKPKCLILLDSHWTYFMQILSNYNTKSLYHFENSVIVALKSDIFTFYTCQIFLTTLKMNKCQLLKKNLKNKTK